VIFSYFADRRASGSLLRASFFEGKGNRNGFPFFKFMQRERLTFLFFAFSFLDTSVFKRFVARVANASRMTFELVGISQTLIV